MYNKFRTGRRRLRPEQMKVMTGNASYKVTAKGDVLTMQPTSAMIVKVNRGD